MLQYMASGLPVIVSQVGMNKDVLKHGNIGFGADNQDEWYQSLKLLYDSPLLRFELGSIGRCIAQRHYDVSVVSRKLAQVMLKFV